MISFFLSLFLFVCSVRINTEEYGMWYHQCYYSEMIYTVTSELTNRIKIFKKKIYSGYWKVKNLIQQRITILVSSVRHLTVFQITYINVPSQSGTHYQTFINISFRTCKSDKHKTHSQLQSSKHISWDRWSNTISITFWKQMD